MKAMLGFFTGWILNYCNLEPVSYRVHHVIALNECCPLGILTVYGPIKSIFTLFHGIVSACLGVNDHTSSSFSWTFGTYDTFLQAYLYVNTYSAST